MDPLMHVLLPVLILLALRIDTRKVLLLAPLAVLPDFDAVFGLHRAVFHSFIPVVVIPVGLILYSRYKRPEWMLTALLVQFYLASHVVLDLGGVAFLWPFTTDMFYMNPELKFNLIGGINFEWHFKAGFRPYESMGDTDFIAQSTFAFLILIALAAAVYRKEMRSALARAWDIIQKAILRD